MDAREVAFRRAWARIAGLMYWLVFAFDLEGMTLGGTSSGRCLSLAGGVLTIPLAYGLYVTTAPVQKTVAATALGFRVLEIVLTLGSVLAAFPVLRSAGADSGMLRFIKWGASTNSAAFFFTIGSSLFFFLFFRSRILPRPLAALGVLASMLAFAACLAHFIHPAFPAMTMWAWIPLIPAELLTGAWLLIRSVRYSPIPALSSAAV